MDDAIKEFYEKNPIALIHITISHQINSLLDYGKETAELIDQALIDLPKVYPHETHLRLEIFGFGLWHPTKFPEA